MQLLRPRFRTSLGLPESLLQSFQPPPFQCVHLTTFLVRYTPAMNDSITRDANVKNEVLSEVWDRSHKHGIRIPYLQRGRHIKFIAEDIGLPP